MKLVQYLRSPQYLSSLFLKEFKDSALTTSAGRLFQVFTTLLVKKYLKLLVLNRGLCMSDDFLFVFVF